MFFQFVFYQDFVCISSPSSPGAEIAQRYRAGLRAGRSGFRVTATAGNLSLHHRVQNGSGAHPASYPMGTRGSFPADKEAGSVKLTIHLHLVPMSKMRGAIPPLPNTPSWRGAQLKKAQGQLYLFRILFPQYFLIFPILYFSLFQSDS
jgi:hypothetical protein